MNKRTRTILILLIALIIAVGAYFLITSLTVEEEESSAQNLFTCDASAIEKIEYTYSDETVILTKKNGSWSYDGDKSFPLDSSAVESMAEAIACVDITNTIGVQSNLTKYGLDDPENIITAYYDSNQVTFTIGDSNTITGGTYIMMSGDDNVYLTESSIAGVCDYTLMQLATSGELPSEMSGATPISITIKKADGTYSMSTPITDIDSYYSGYSWQAVTPEGTIIANTNTVTETVSDITGIDLASLAAYGVDEAKLSEMGFDNAIEIMYTYEYTITNEDGESEDTYQDTFSFKLAQIPESSSYYIYVEGDTCVYTASQYAVQNLMKLDHSSLLTEEVFVLDYSTIEGMTVTYGGNTYEVTITREENEDGEAETTAELNGKSVGAAYVEGFFEDLLSLERDITSEDTADGDPEFTVVFHRNTNDVYSEMTLTITPYDSSFAQVSFAGSDDSFINIRDLNTIIDSFENVINMAK